MAVVGASGSGKSSLVRAGLVPAFRRAREGSVAVMTPGSDPEAELRRVARTGPPSLLVVDQLEEAFTLCPDEAARGSLLRRPDGPARGGLDVDRGRPPGGLLRTLRRASAPRRRAGRAPAPARADADRTSCAGRSRVPPARRGFGSRPAWSTRCWPTSKASPAPSRCSPTPSTSRGPAATAGSSRGRATARPAACGERSRTRPRRSSWAAAEQEQALMRRMFLRLTELGETTEDTRRRVPLAELIPEGEGGEEAAAVLEQLAGARLLVVGDDSAEIAHEALIREWPRLRGWLAEDREELRAAPPADDRGSLLGGERDATRPISIAGRAWRRRSSWRATSGSSRASSASSCEASRDAQDRELQNARRRARRLRVLLAVVAAALVVAVIAGAVRARPARQRAAHGDRRPGRAARRPVARGRGAASGPRAPARAGGGPPRRLGRHPRCAPGRARARLADPRVAPGVRRARQRARRSARTAGSSPP